MASYYFRLIHRYLGFFLAGIMAMYALSGIIMVFRNTDFLKHSVEKEQTIDAHLSPDVIGERLKIRNLKVEKEENGVYFFKDGSYNSETGVANYTKMEYPYFIDKMTHLHKATTKDSLYFLNIFFGISLFFFVISSFWMFLPSTNVFKKGLYFTLAGLILTLVMLFI